MYVVYSLYTKAMLLQVEDWESRHASAHPNSVVDSTGAKRRKVYFGCRDIHNDPQVFALTYGNCHKYYSNKTVISMPYCAMPSSTSIAHSIFWV